MGYAKWQNKLLVLCLILLLNSLSVWGQSDSLNIVFLGYGPKREKIKLFHQKQELLNFKSDGGFLYNLKIAKQPEWKDGTPLNLYLHRKGPFSIFFKYIDFNPYYNKTLYEKGKKYYVILRDRRLKNKYLVQTSWEECPPKLPD